LGRFAEHLHKLSADSGLDKSSLSTSKEALLQRGGVWGRDALLTESTVYNWRQHLFRKSWMPNADDAQAVLSKVTFQKSGPMV
jgi:hypothetical protein